MNPRLTRFFVLLIVTFFAVITARILHSPTPLDGPKGPENTLTIQQTVAALPLRFEANHGQTDERVSFLARGPAYGVFLTPMEAVLTLRSPSAKPSSQTESRVATKHQPAVVRM